MKKAIKNNLWEKFKDKAQILIDWVSSKTNLLLSKVGLNFSGIIAGIILIIAAIAAVFITLGIVSILIFLLVFYVIFIVISSLAYSLFGRNK